MWRLMIQIFCSTSHSINVQKIFKIVLAKAFDLKVRYALQEIGVVSSSVVPDRVCSWPEDGGAYMMQSESGKDCIPSEGRNKTGRAYCYACPLDSQRAD